MDDFRGKDVGFQDQIDTIKNIMVKAVPDSKVDKSSKSLLATLNEERENKEYFKLFNLKMVLIRDNV